MTWFLLFIILIILKTPRPRENGRGALAVDGVIAANPRQMREKHFSHLPFLWHFFGRRLSVYKNTRIVQRIFDPVATQYLATSAQELSIDSFYCQLCSSWHVAPTL